METKSGVSSVPPGLFLLTYNILKMAAVHCIMGKGPISLTASLMQHTVNLGHYLIITIFGGPGWPMFSKNTLILYQQDLQLVPYFVKWQLAID